MTAHTNVDVDELIQILGQTQEHRQRVQEGATVTWLDDPLPQQVSAVIQLGEIAHADPDPKVITALIEALNHPSRNWQVLSRAAQALGQSDDPRAFDALVEASGSGHWAVRREIPEALARLDSVRAVEHLVCMLNDDDVYVRRAAAGTLGVLGCITQDAIDALMEVAENDDDWTVRDAARDTLHRVTSGV